MNNIISQDIDNNRFIAWRELCDILYGISIVKALNCFDESDISNDIRRSIRDDITLAETLLTRVLDRHNVTRTDYDDNGVVSKMEITSTINKVFFKEDISDPKTCCHDADNSLKTCSYDADNEDEIYLDYR